MAQEDKKRYAADWKTWTLIPAGAGWAFAVGIIEQGQAGRFRVRVAKGKMKVAAPGELPITQQAKFNLKVADWKALRDAIDYYIAELENPGSGDLHAQAAAEMFGVPVDEVTDEQRAAAQATNFGRLYGQNTKPEPDAADGERKSNLPSYMRGKGFGSERRGR